MKIENILSKIFRIGLLISVVIILTGLFIISLKEVSKPSIPLENIFTENPTTIITFGIIVLMSMPIIGLITLFVYFLKSSNKFFIIVTLYTLLLIMITIYLLL
ncbi:MAG: DUF1634 domain-containing protein [Thermoprotei archaeon]